MARAIRGVMLLTAVLLAPISGAAQQPSVADTLKRAGAHIEAFQKQLSGIVAEETYVQSVHRGSFTGGVGVDPATRVLERRLRSDLLLVRPVGADRYVEFRDVFEVDGKLVRDREERLSRLFLDPPPGALNQLERVMNESARYNIGNVMRTMNTPLLSLGFLHPRYQSHFRFAIDEVRAGVITIVYRETKRPTLIRTPRRLDMPAHGRFSIDSATGAVIKTELVTQDTQVTGRVIVSYVLEPTLGFRVPSTMDESYSSGRERIDGKATYGRFRRFQVNVDETIKPVKP